MSHNRNYGGNNNVCSEDDDDEYSHQRSERFESYADVSESESSGRFSSDSLEASTSHTPPLLSSYRFKSNSRIMLPVAGRKIAGKTGENETSATELSEVQLMKERFANLLLGEDMSGRGRGICSALVISNAITNLSDTVFGELLKLKPLDPQTKSMWRREMDCLLSISDSIVEFIPSSQEAPDGRTFEVMVTRPRPDLYVNLPALKKLDALIIGLLDGFRDSEFYYVDRGIVVANGENIAPHNLSSLSERNSIQFEEKCWLPFPKVPPNGLAEDTMRRLQQCKECANQIFKAAMAINSSVLAEMEIPNSYLESLSKSGKACLGETLYRYVTAAQFSPECLLGYLELSSEYTTLGIANRIEAAVHIWRKKSLKDDANSGRSLWSGTVKGFVVDTERSKLLSERAEIILRNLKFQFPGLPQTTLDIKKIQCNKDVGHSILESYSRAIVGVAFNIMARIDDLLYVDDATKKRVAAEMTFKLAPRGFADPISPHMPI